MTITDHTLAELLAAYCYYQKINCGSELVAEPSAGKRSDHLLQYITQMSTRYNETIIKLDVNKRLKKHNKVLNLVENMKQNQEIFKIVSNICEAKDIEC